MKKELKKLPKNKTLADLKVSKRCRDMIEKHIKIHKGNLDLARQKKYRYSCTRFADILEKDLDKIESKEEVLELRNVLHASKLSVSTLQDMVSEVKNFYRDMFEDEDFTQWILTKLNAPTPSTRLKLDKYYKISEEKVHEAIKCCRNSRDKFIIALCGLDGAVRPIELRRAKWCDVQRDEEGDFIVIQTAKKSGDKPTRQIRIIKSLPYYQKYCDEYPLKKSSNNYLFVNFANHGQLNHSTLHYLMKSVQKKLGITKGTFSTYSFRHSLLTRHAKNPNISMPMLKKFAGHSQRSNSIAEYIHLDDDDLKEMQLEINGIKKKEVKVSMELKPIACPKCKGSNPHDADFCNFCNQALTQLRQVEKHDTIRIELAEMKEQMQEIMEAQRFADATNSKLGLFKDGMPYVEVNDTEYNETLEQLKELGVDVKKLKKKKFNPSEVNGQDLLIKTIRLLEANARAEEKPNLAKN